MLFAGSFIRPGNLGAYILHTQKSPPRTSITELRELVHATYDVSFAFPRRERDRVALFIPEYDLIEQNQAETYLRYFDIGDILYTTEDNSGAFYIFVGKYGELHVNKYFNRIIVRFYEQYYSPQTEVLTEEAALQTALAYMERIPLRFEYAGSNVIFKDNKYIVSFYREVGGIILRDHVTSLTMDETGNILSLDYYNVSYEKISTVGLKTMRSAFYSLPPLDYNTKVDIKKCTLVYKFIDSILQPVYKFEGEIIQYNETQPFIYYINASIFS